jgi:hypothetical protein
MSCTLGFVVSILHRDAAVPGADISASRQAYFTANIRSPAIGIAPIRGLSTEFLWESGLFTGFSDAILRFC